MKSPYRMLGIEVGIHFIIMFIVMYTMVYAFNDAFLNINNVYMTGMMVAPMVSLMLVMMGHMYKDKRLNLILHVSSIVIFFALLFFERHQTFVGNEQFLRSMIPHHSGAILMCEKSSITDPEIKSLCSQIISSQKSEIGQMKDILSRLNSSR